MKIVDLTGQRFGKLTVVERLPKYRGKVTYYRCTCDCGGESIVFYGNLGRGTMTCGCGHKDAAQVRVVPKDQRRVTAMLTYYKRNAKLRNVEWLLTKDEFDFIVRKSCEYCGHFDTKTLSGVDRIDNSKGYTLDNSVPCCRWCNWGKNERTLEEFRDWVERLYERQVLVYERRTL